MQEISSPKFFGSFLLFVCLFFPFFTSLKAQTAKPPVIIIPGITGSELVNKKTGEVVWFKAQRAKEDDLRLPVTSTNLSLNRDNLVPRDILRGVRFARFLPETEIYGNLSEALEKRDGYKEGSWERPAARGHEATYYVFAYDWRRDNVENARILMKKIIALKRKLKRPNLKFTIFAHSMGGLITRYAAMYGDADIPDGKITPTWAGAKHIGKIFLLGTPNEGSILSLNTLINGYALGGIKLNLPFVQNLSRYDVFTLPSIYQLLPHEGSLQAFDEMLQPLKIDLYAPETWEKYGWSIFNGKDFAKEFTPAEQKNARAYFKAVLERAERFQTALKSNTGKTAPIEIFIVGGDCRETPAGMVIYNRKGKWKTLFEPDGFERENGERVTSEELRKIMFAEGDGVVTKRSLLLQTLNQNTSIDRILPVNAEVFFCESHTKLISNKKIQDRMFDLFPDQK